MTCNVQWVGVHPEKRGSKDEENRVFFVLALSTLLALPNLARAETWEEFTDRAKAAMNAGGAKAVVEVSGNVDCFRYEENESTFEIEPLDKALIVAEGKQLIIRGGSFDGMLLGRGNFTLESVSVTAGTNDVPAILLDSADASQVITLHLDAETRLTTLKKGVSAISNRYVQLRNIRSFPVMVRIENRGHIEVVGKSPAIELNYINNGMEPIALEVENTGEIRSHVSMYAKTEDNVALRLLNREAGSIYGEAGSVLDATSYWGVVTLEFDNGPKAVIRSTSTPGENKDSAAAVSLRANWHEESWLLAGNDFIIRNEGEIYGHNALMLGGLLSVLNNLEYRDEERGEVQGPYLSLEFTLPHYRGMEVITQEDFESSILGWLLLQELPDLSPLTMVQATVGLDYYDNDEIWQTTYPLEPVEFLWGVIEANRKEGYKL